MTNTHLHTDAETLEMLAALTATPMPCAEHARMPFFAHRKRKAREDNK